MGEVTHYTTALDAPIDESEPAEFGWEVEYVDKVGHTRTNHPAARRWELVSDRNETVPTLVLSDEDGEAIALYNGISWVAARRNARRSGGAQ